MSDDVDRRVAVLESRVDSLAESLDEVEQLLAGEDYHEVRQQRDNLFRVIEQLLARIDTLEQRVETLEGLQRHEGKDAKVEQIVQYAENQRRGAQRGIAVTPKEIRGVVGCSRRYAYDLVEELPEQYPFLVSREDARQYGELELDHEQRSKALVVVLDQECELVHSDGPSVNRFTTRDEREGGAA